ncbi:MAG: trypsin-like peptidase domain-containing protein [Dehalococcoidia bacterium]|jgi:putative serine protease PepD
MKVRVSWRNHLFLFVPAGIGLSLLALAATACSSGSSSAQSTTAPVTLTPAPPRPVASAPAGNEGDIIPVYAKVSPAVVQVTGISTSSGQQVESLGSGIVIDSSGDVLTNFHVIQGATQLAITLSDQAGVTAQVVGTDPADDLAVVKGTFPGISLTTATLGDSNAVQVGESVIAIGNPFGLILSVTEGIVSGDDRTLATQSSKPLVDLFQTDAAINPGNSGGPLVDLSGNVIGINTALENPSGQDVNVGVGYVIPIQNAKDHLPDMLAGKTIVHPKLGAGTITVTQNVAKVLGLTVNQGAYVVAVDSGGPADQAGLKAAGTGPNPLLTPKGGDVIVGADSQQINSSDDLINYVDHNYAPGDKITLHVVRGSSHIDLTATLAAWPNP